VTSVDDELYVLLERTEKQVAVFSLNDYKLLSRLHVPDFRPTDEYGDMNDLTSCVRHKCLYMSDNSKRCIHRYGLAGKAVSKWPVPGKPNGLSVTPGCNLLVSIYNKLVELSADGGQCVREISLQSDIEYPWHSVQLTSGQFVVCHSNVSSGLRRVFAAGDDGKVARSYGGQRGTEVGKLDTPHHMAVDKDSQFIFVADQGSGRITLLSPTLEYVRDFSEGLSRPCRLYFHQATRRLFVGQLGDDKCNVTIIQL